MDDHNRDGEHGGLLDKAKDMLGGALGHGERSGPHTGEDGGVEGLHPDTAAGTDAGTFAQGGATESGLSDYSQRGGGTEGYDRPSDAMAGQEVLQGGVSERNTSAEGGYPEYGTDRDRYLDEDRERTEGRGDR